jgi:hypothetical protein
MEDRQVRNRWGVEVATNEIDRRRGNHNIAQCEEAARNIHQPNPLALHGTLGCALGDILANVFSDTRATLTDLNVQTPKPIPFRENAENLNVHPEIKNDVDVPPVTRGMPLVHANILVTAQQIPNEPARPKRAEPLNNDPERKVMFGNGQRQKPQSSTTFAQGIADPFHAKPLFQLTSFDKRTPCTQCLQRNKVSRSTPPLRAGVDRKTPVD